MEKKKIAIITLHAVKNYGSILQAYATQMIFEQMGLDVTIIDYRRPWETRKGYYLYHRKHDFKDILRQIMYFPSKLIQKRSFAGFMKENIKLSNETYTCSCELKDCFSDVDIFCTGSDQVWNSGWNEGIIDAYFLSFASTKKKKISYAASFGTDALVEEERNIIKKYLEEYNSISVREISSLKLLQDMDIPNAQVVLDPTLQLKKTDWQKIVDLRRVNEKNYVLLIQLNRNHEFDRFAVEFARKKKKKLIRLCLRLDQLVLPGKPVIIPPVVDYLNYINNSDYILTDSFHAVSFALNFNKEFYCVLPKSYSSRLKSILEITNLENRIIRDCLADCYDKEPIDYNRVNKIIYDERERSMCYLKEAIGV